MDTKKPAVDRILESLGPALAAEIARSVQEAQGEQKEEFSKQLENAVREVQSAADRASAELRQQMDERLRLAEAAWAEERARLEDELQRWRTYAEAQQTLGESATQSEMLFRFLNLAEPFARSLAIYVMKADGLGLWKQRGEFAFPGVVSQNTIDPELYFAPVVVRQKKVAAICAQQPFKREALEFLAGTLARSIELFGAKLQSAAVGTRAVEDGVVVRS